MKTLKPIKLKNPSIPYDGWTIKSDIVQKSFVPSFKLHLEPEQEKGYITGHELRTRLEGKPVLSAAVLDYLIEHPELAPESWKERTKDGLTQFIFFWGTIYRDRGDDLYVRYWYWDEGRWQSIYRWLDYRWSGDDPSALLASPGNSDTQPGTETLETLSSRVERLEAIMEAIRKALI